jgi:hypothetical protein
MAHLTQEEFTQTIGILAADMGLQSLRDRLVRLNALVTRRRATSVDQLAGQLYQLTGGLRRQVPATVALQSLWAERVNAKIDEQAEKELEEIINAINSCLGERDAIIEGKEAELDQHLQRYEQCLSALVGAERARLDMLLKALPRVADRLRSLPPPPALAPAAESQPAPSTETPATPDSES